MTIDVKNRMMQASEQKVLDVFEYPSGPGAEEEGLKLDKVDRWGIRLVYCVCRRLDRAYIIRRIRSRASAHALEMQIQNYFLVRTYQSLCAVLQHILPIT